MAQFRTSVQGVVTDPDGAVIPGATLTLKNNATNETVVRTSDSAGVFNFNALPSAVFTLTATKAGFQKATLDHLQFIPGAAELARPCKMSLGNVSETVTVDANAEPAVDTETSNIGATVSSNEIQHLPSFNRDVFTLTQLVPGVIDDGAQGSGGGNYGRPGNQGPGGSGAGGQFPTENGPQANANGGQYETNGISIDGISTVSAVWGGTTVITPNEDSIENVRVVTNDYDAENGRFSGARDPRHHQERNQPVSRQRLLRPAPPGLNAFQRAIYNNGVKTGTPQKDTQRFNQYGGSLGGPIWKDKIFAFFAYESSPNGSNSTGTGWYETCGLPCRGQHQQHRVKVPQLPRRVPSAEPSSRPAKPALWSAWWKAPTAAPSPARAWTSDRRSPRDSASRTPPRPVRPPIPESATAWTESPM